MNSYDISQALKTENLTDKDYQEICKKTQLYYVSEIFT